MKYYVAYNADSGQYVIRHGYGGEEDMVHSSYFKHSIAANTARELNARG